MTVLREIHPVGVKGPITARQAFDLAEKELRNHISTALRCTFISAGEYIDHRGYSLHWEFFFESPESAQLAIITIEPLGDAWEDVQPTLHISVELKQRVKKVSQRFLPSKFLDSPEAVAALEKQGADWISGDIHMTLSTKFSGTGEAVWCTETYGRVIETSFSVI